MEKWETKSRVTCAVANGKGGTLPAFRVREGFLEGETLPAMNQVEEGGAVR